MSEELNQEIETQGSEVVADQGVEAPSAEKPILDEVKEAVAALAPEASKDEKPAEEPVATEAKPAEEPKPNELYQIPKGLNGEARAKYKALSDHARGLESQAGEASEQVTKLTERLSGFESVLKDAHATPEILSAHLGYIKACATGDLQAAYDFVNAERAALAKALGVKVDGVDLLEEFPDLKQRIDNMELTEEAAIELANWRRQGESRKREDQRAAELAGQREQVERAEAGKAAAVRSISEWVGAQKDIDWPVYEKAISDYLGRQSTKQILANIPAEHWLEHIKDYYDSIRSLPAPQQARQPGPLRSRASGGSLVREPSSDIDAVKQALGYAS